MIGRVGEDASAEEAMYTLRKEGVDLLPHPGHQPSVQWILLALVMHSPLR